MNTKHFIYCRLFYLFCFVVMLFYFLDNRLLFQLEKPVLLYPSADNFYWLLLLLNIPQTIVMEGIYFDLFLLVSITLCIVKPKPPYNLLFFALYTLYYATINIYFAHHMHSQMGIWLISLVLCFNNKNAYRFWELARYYTCFIFVSAALWKIGRGSVFHVEHLSLVITGQVENNNPNFLQQFLIQHAGFSYIGFLIITALQGLFFIGFFTKKWDKMLISLFLIFFLLDFLVMHLHFIEIYPLLLTFMITNNSQEVNFKTASVNG